MSIKRHLVAPSAPPQCVRVFYVLDLSSKHDSPKGGVFEYDPEELQQSVWRHLPPAGFDLDPPLPAPGDHASYRDPGCIYQCLPMFDKARRCLGLVRSYEGEVGLRFTWVVRSRPDLRWLQDGGPGSLARLSQGAAYARFTEVNATAPADEVLVVPRRLAEPLFEDLLERCHLHSEAEASPKCHSWSCQCWIQRFIDAKGISIRPLDLRFEIRRLPSAMPTKQAVQYRKEYDSASNQMYTWRVHKVWNRKLRGLIAPGLGELQLGHEVVSRGSLAPLPPGEEGNATCVTYLESELCTWRSALLNTVAYFIDVPIKHSWPATRLGVWRPVEASGARLLNSSHYMMLWSTTTTKRSWLGPQDLVLGAGAAVPMRRGDCLGWTACGGSPIPFDEPGEGEHGGLALQHGSRSMPSSMNVHGPFRRAPWRRYSLAANLWAQGG